jgi:hypothetical protein
MDDKAKIPLGVPYGPVQAVVRQKPVLTPIDGGVVCSDHEYESDSDEPPALTNEWNDDDEYGYGGTYRFGHSVLNEVERAISVPLGPPWQFI